MVLRQASPLIDGVRFCFTVSGLMFEAINESEIALNRGCYSSMPPVKLLWYSRIAADYDDRIFSF